LHDAVTQTLFSASIFTDMLPLQLAQEPEQLPRNLEKLGQLIRSALAEMRTLLMELRPTALVVVELHQLIGNLINAAHAHGPSSRTLLKATRLDR
jgi:signal transduction histidine kinase